jgi:hypothetical protein
VHQGQAGREELILDSSQERGLVSGTVEQGKQGVWVVKRVEGTHKVLEVQLDGITLLLSQVNREHRLHENGVHFVIEIEFVMLLRNQNNSGRSVNKFTLLGLLAFFFILFN